MGVVLGIDLGTSNFKFTLVNRNGKSTGFARVPVTYVSDSSAEASGTCIMPGGNFLEYVRKGIETVCSQSADKRIEGISYSSQANSFLLLDSGGDPLTPVVSWQDRRAEGMRKGFEAFCEQPEFLLITGMGVSTVGMTAAKLLWYQHERPEIWRRTARVVSISDYLSYLLTGAYHGDTGTASLSGLMDTQHGSWWNRAVAAFGLTPELLPQLKRPGRVLGRVATIGAGQLGVPVGIPVAAGSLDHHMAALGSGVGALSDASESTGTVVAGVRLSQKYNPATGRTVGPGILPGTYFELVFADGGGSVLQEYRERFAPDLSFADLDRLAMQVEPGADGLTVWYAGGGDPPRASAPPASHGAHARAIMETVAARLALLMATAFPTAPPAAVSATGGGSASEIWSQIKADMLGCPVVLTKNNEPACHGAAILAAGAAGWFDIEEGTPESWIEAGAIYSPRPEYQARYKELMTEL